MGTKYWLLSGLIFFCSLIIYTGHTNATLNSSQVQIGLKLKKDQQIGRIGCYYNTGQGYNESQKLNLALDKNEYYVGRISTNGGLKDFRLDFPKNSSFEILGLWLQFGDKKWLYQPNEITHLVKNYSLGIRKLSFGTSSVFVKTGNGDPYISFKTFGPNTHTSFFWILALLCFIYPLGAFVKKEFIDSFDLDCLPLFLFIVAIPLKESLSTFAVLCFLLVEAFKLYQRKGAMYWSPIMWLCILYLVPIPYTFFNSLHTNIGIYLGAAFFLLAISQIKFDKEQINRIRRFYFLFTLVFSILFLGLIYYVVGTNGLSLMEYFNNPKSIGPYIAPFFPYYHPTFLSYFFGVSVLIGVKSRFFDGISKAIIVIFLIMSTSRYALYMVLLWVCLILMKRKSVSKYAYLVVSLISFLGTYVAAYLFDGNRREQWDFYLEGATKLIGNGLNPTSVLINGTSYTHAHSQFIWYLSIYGIIPSVMLLGYSLYLLVFNTESKNIFRIFVATCFIALCIIESPFNTNKASLMVSFVLGFFLIENGGIIGKEVRKI